jgi:hypothetical protein
MRAMEELIIMYMTEESEHFNEKDERWGKLVDLE